MFSSMLLQARAMRGRFHQGNLAANGELGCRGTWCPDAAGLERQTRPGSTLQRRGSIFIGGKKDWKWLERVFRVPGGLNKRETE